MHIPLISDPVDGPLKKPPLKPLISGHVAMWTELRRPQSSLQLLPQKMVDFSS